MSGRVESRRVLVGKPQFLREQGVNGVDKMESKAAEFQEQGSAHRAVADGNHAVHVYVGRG